METASTSVGPQSEEVPFEISEEAGALIRSRGGQAWIWPDIYHRLHATTGPPQLHKSEWWRCTPRDLVVHVDRTILPPKQWVIATAEGRLVARWDGRNPDLFGRPPLVQPEGKPAEDPPERTSSPLAHLGGTLVVPALAWVIAVLGALRFFGVRGSWLWVGRAACFAALSVVGIIVWLLEKVAERRKDTALARELESHFARSRARQGERRG